MKFIKWLSTILQIIGAILVAANFRFSGYCFFCFGSSCALIAFAKSNDKAMLAQFGFYLLINIGGLYNAIA